MTTNKERKETIKIFEKLSEHCEQKITELINQIDRYQYAINQLKEEINSEQKDAIKKLEYEKSINQQKKVEK